MPIILFLLSLSVVFLLISEKIISTKNIKSPQFLAKAPALTKLLASGLMIYFFSVSIPTFHVPFPSIFSNLILAALVLSFLGDALLIPKTKSQYFLAGILSFALAHSAYSLAFLQLSFDNIIFGISTALNLIAGFIVYNWLKSHLNGHYRLMVPAYLIIILMMVILGTTVGVSNQNYWLVGGSLLFAISDVFVARNRFVKPAFINRLIGLPLYYTAQIMIAHGAIKIIALF